MQVCGPSLVPLEPPPPSWHTPQLVEEGLAPPPWWAPHPRQPWLTPPSWIEDFLPYKEGCR
jgi:hypothetical protein